MSDSERFFVRCGEWSDPDRWPQEPKQALALQCTLQSKIRIEPPPWPIRLVAGLDAAFLESRNLAIGAAVLWDRYDRQVIATAVGQVPIRFPYIPGYLSFREAPALLAALVKLPQAPDALLVDGQGIAHPRRLGIATHLGVLLDWPSVGCAKSRLFGHAPEPQIEQGAFTWLREGNRVLGVVLRTRRGVKPVFVSPGHRMDVDGARELVLSCALGYRLPEPTRQAHILAGKAKRAATEDSQPAAFL